MEWGPIRQTPNPMIVTEELFDERGIFVGAIIHGLGPLKHMRLVNTQGKVILQMKANCNVPQAKEILIGVYERRRYPHRQLPLER